MWRLILIISSCTIPTMANTCPQTYATACGVPLETGLSSSDKEDILEAHNKLRDVVARGLETRGNSGPQPSASDMRLMTWNEALAKTAQDWANQCDFSHNTCGGNPNFTVGQNIYAITAKALINFNFTQPVASWYDEVQYFNSSSVSPFTYLEKASHYTQLAWSKTRYLGCGFIAYNTTSGTVWHTIVCNYGPAGNYAGAAMYNTTGKPCTSCTSCSEEYTGLCE